MKLFAPIGPHVNENGKTNKQKKTKQETHGPCPLLDNTDKSSKHIVTYDKQMHKTTTKITLNTRTNSTRPKSTIYTPSTR